MKQSKKETYQKYQEEAHEHERFWKKNVKEYAIVSFLVLACIIAYFIFKYMN